MLKNIKNAWIFGLLSSLAITACDDESTSNNKSGVEDLASAFGQEDDKVDALKSTKLLDDIALDSEIVGKFDPRLRVYGYTVQARRGAKLTISLSAVAGNDAEGTAKGDALDTRLAIYGAYESAKKPGELLIETDDDGNNVAAPPIVIEIAEDAKYLIAFSSWVDTGTAAYKLEVSCEGTDLQCSRPNLTKPCKKGTLYVQGSTVDKDTTWDKCDTIILEPLTVAKEAILTIKPGVTVQGNFIGAEPFGDVQLIVDGTLQAVGTEKDPIIFTSFKDGMGWGGIVLNGISNSIEAAYIQWANKGVMINQGASATILDTVIEGLVINDQIKSVSGVETGRDVEATFSRAVVKKFQTGLRLENSHKLTVEDSVIRENNLGVLIVGAGGRTTSCGNATAQTVFRDPIFNHTDIVNNQSHGVRIQGSDVLVQIENSNIINNAGNGIVIEGRQLAPESFIINNNIHSNTASPTAANPQVLSYHSQGLVDLSGNYWVHISDPELSASWRMGCSGEFTFTGFSPEPIAEAGPRKGEIFDNVKEQTYFEQQQQQQQ